jgi:hypothetical protein
VRFFESLTSRENRLTIPDTSLLPIATALFLAAGCVAGVRAQNPVITSISPSSAIAGGSGFTLTVNGANFLKTSVVQVNGAARATTFVGETQLSASILASDIATAGTEAITVFNSPLAAAGGTSNAVSLTVSALALPPPTLTGAGPAQAAQGAGRIQIILQGTNFRPGATVVISPPLASLTASNGRTQATDVGVIAVNQISSTLMTATISLSPTASIGLRGIDVLNTDGSSTGAVIGAAAVNSGTTKPLQVRSSTSIAAPVSILNIALLDPRDGTVATLGGDLYAQAILSGTGTGTLIGQWLWDGRAVEQFAASLVGGQSVTIRTRQSFPTFYLGPHTIQLRMLQPSQIATKPVDIVINPAGWQREVLLSPRYGAAYSSSEPPMLLWAPVPGAIRYQVGFSAEPYLTSIDHWYDVDENRWPVPIDVWRQQSEGSLYWTVRAVTGLGSYRKPLPLRSIVHLAPNALGPLHLELRRSAAGHPLIEWTLANPGAFYLVTVGTDAEGTQILRRYLTDKGVLDLHAVAGRLIPGKAYFWHIDVFSHWGDFLFSGAVQRFVAPRVPGLPEARLKQFPNHATLQYASLASVRHLGYFDLRAQIAKETPSPDSSVAQTEPAVSVQFQSPVNPAEISLVMDDIDVTSLAQVGELQAVYTPQLPLANGDHDVSLTVGAETSGWKFTIAASPVAVVPAASGTVTLQPGTDAEAQPTPAAAGALSSALSKRATKPAPSNREFGGEIDSQISSTTQWASGSNPPDSNVLSVAERMISENSSWKPELNGSGLLNSILNPPVQRTSQGRVNDYIAQIEKNGVNWGVGLRFGIVSPALYNDAQFVTAATPRQGVEAMLTTPGGKVGFYANTDDQALGGGAGITFHQRLMGTSWQAPLPKWAEFRLMWLGARDIGAPTVVEYDAQGNPIVVPNPVAAKSRGDVYGALLNIHLSEKWRWSSEYAWSYDDANLNDPTAKTLFGRAWRTGISGTSGKANVSVAFRDLSPNFGNPANPSLTQSSNPDLRGLDASANDPTKGGTFALTYSFLQNNVNSTTTAELNLNSFSETWSKPLGKSTNLSIGANQSVTKTRTIPAALPPDQNGSADQRDVSGYINLTRQVGMIALSAGANRDWLRNNLQSSAGAITSSASLGANLATKGIFQCNSQLNLSWVAADPANIGETRNISLNLQPSLVWKQPSLQVAPLISVVQARTQLASGTATSDTLTGQYGGRLAWTLPGRFKTNIFSVQGSYNQNRDDVNHTNTPNTQLIAIWTYTWAHKRTF